MHSWSATTAPGLEPIVARELESLGVAVTIEPGAVCFTADWKTGARLSLQARTPTRLLLTVTQGPAHSYDQLMALIRQTDWTPFLHQNAEIDIAVSYRGSKIAHKQAMERKVNRALRDVRRGLKSRKNLQCPQRLQVRVVDNQARLSLDVAGALLHRRGWRIDTGRAPLRENFAASLLIAAGWTGDEPLVDPFCGVGTFPIEAALMATERSPHIRREFAWREWPGITAPPALPAPNNAPTRPALTILGSDKEPTALERCQSNAQRAGVHIDWQCADVAELEPPAGTGLVVANPPFGRRLGQQVAGVYTTFGHTLRSRFNGWRVIFLAPHPDLARKVHRSCEQLTVFPLGGSRVGVYIFSL